MSRLGPMVALAAATLIACTDPSPARHPATTSITARGATVELTSNEHALAIHADRFMLGQDATTMQFEGRTRFEIHDAANRTQVEATADRITVHNPGDITLDGRVTTRFPMRQNLEKSTELAP